jgi:hypothetical protein
MSRSWLWKNRLSDAARAASSQAHGETAGDPNGCRVGAPAHATLLGPRSLARC